ncbi:MAG: DUF1214 domain-containing protein [Deltaproteobacteria bacterium]|nr:DUF1214 domain-containing protein [Deltaproteobacteria bacterium]
MSNELVGDAVEPDPGLLWDEFCEALKRAGDVLRRPETPSDPQTLAEGYRFLMRMVRVGFENHFELADLDHPQLVPMVGRLLQYEGITSDARYLHALIDGRATHRIRGTRGEAPLFEIGTYTGKHGMHEPSHLIASITEQTLEVGPDGGVEIVLGPDPHPGNWIRTDEQTRYVMIRQYAADWSRRTAGRFALERVGGVPGRPPVAPEAIRDALLGTAAFAERNPMLWAGISDYWAGNVVNRFLPQVEADARTDIAPPSGHHFSCGYFDVEPDAALRIEFRPGRAAYWSLGLSNYWYETIGYGDPTTHLNSGTAVADRDGTVRLVLAHSKPPASAGIPNWLDPKGHREGTMVFRWSRPIDPIPEIRCELVPWRSL